MTDPHEISSVVGRAYLAIRRAKALTERIAASSNSNSDAAWVDDSHENGADISNASRASLGTPASLDLDPETHSPRLRSAQPLLDVALRLQRLQEQQSSTLSQLLGLRLEQLWLRQQQLSALQELLRAESAVAQGTHLQMSAVHQALQLLGQSLEDMDLAAAAITATATSSSGISDITSIALTVSRADARAEDISRMARQLLSVLREYPRQASSPALATADHSATGHLLTRGATTTELAALARTCCEPGHPLLLAEQSCAICLADFTVGDCLMALHCGHQLHQPCLEEWLRLRASCPLCKATLPGAEFDSSHALGVTSSGAQDAEST